MQLPAKLQYLTLASAMLISLTAHAQSGPQNPMLSNMNAQLAKLGGTMHVTAKICGDYSSEELAEQKQQQKNHMTRGGMDAASFEEAFSAGTREGEEKWRTVPESEKQATCDKIKQEMADLTQQITR